MRRKRKILLVLLLAFIAIQFMQPHRNKAIGQQPADIVKVVFIPVNVKRVLQTACYDCHSNNTNYPWYAYIQPFAWLLDNHVENGKKDLNFSEFSSYSLRRQQSKLKSIASQLHDGDMPLWSYTFMHKDAQLTKEDKALIWNWAQQTADSLSQKNE